MRLECPYRRLCGPVVSKRGFSVVADGKIVLGPHRAIQRHFAGRKGGGV